MSDPAAGDRHERHESIHEEHRERLRSLEEQAVATRIWCTGNGSPHRGAEARLTRLEEEAIMRSEIKAIAAEVVAEYQKSTKAKVQAFAPYALMLIGIVYALVTGKPPQVGP